MFPFYNFLTWITQLKFGLFLIPSSNISFPSVSYYLIKCLILL